MAIGDQAKSANFNLVPDSGEDGRVRWGGREINRTRDYIAQVLAKIPIGQSGYRSASGISSGPTLPSTGAEGDIFFKIL